MTANGIIQVYDMINYIRRYISNNDIPNFANFPYFEYENLLDIILNGLRGLNGYIENDIIYLNYYKIFIINNNNLNIYEIFIEFNDLTEPLGPLL